MLWLETETKHWIWNNTTEISEYQLYNLYCSIYIIPKLGFECRKSSLLWVKGFAQVVKYKIRIFIIWHLL